MSLDPRFDYALHMHVEEPKILSLNHLGFLRYLAESGRLEHDAVGPAEGPIVDLIADIERRQPAYAGKSS